MKEDILRKIYDGDYVPNEHIFADEERIKSQKHIMNEMHNMIWIALCEKYGEQEAMDIDNEYINAYTSITNEEMINAFKEGFYLGFELLINTIKR